MRLDQLQFLDLCRDAECDREDLHRPHPVDGQTRAPVIRVTRRLLVDIALEAVSLRIPKSFAQIYTDVVDDYGAITERNVHVALRELVDHREVAYIVPAGLQDVAHKHGIRGAYLRYDSPLLWRSDGLPDLMSQVYELMYNDDDSCVSRRRACARG